MYLPYVGFEIPHNLDGFLDIARLSLIVQRIDQNGKLMAVSKGWSDAFGYECSGVIGRYLGDYLTEDSRNQMEDNIKKTVADRPASFVRVFVCADGSEKAVEVWLHRDLNEDELESSTSIMILKD
jgi:PAS domain S-box-containing protein